MSAVPSATSPDRGALLMTAQEYGFDVVGCDLRQATVDALAAQGIEAHCQDIAQLRLSRACSVISMADVLEHMPYPKIGLRAAHGLLEPGGLLFLSMPNSESRVWQVLSASGRNPYWCEVEHYHNFGRSRLFRLLEEESFEPIRYGVSQRYRLGMEVIARKR